MDVNRIENHNRKQQRTIFASGCILAAGGMWGTMGLWVRRLTAEGLASMQILALRIVVTAVMMLVFLADGTVFHRSSSHISSQTVGCAFTNSAIRS